MIDSYDIAFMKQAREDMVGGRTYEITVIYEAGFANDPITDEKKPVYDEIKIPSVVTEISSEVKIDRQLLDSIDVEGGDIWFSIAIELIADIYENIKRVIYDGKNYEVLSKDKKGIGERNHAEFVGRRIT
ncbi:MULTISPECIES: hypothetical protein [unclassified Bacillus (in: firmicutes)]|uniref:hypothetical protein n=1 Tax=unclassified Bacillus (in: firmicutes) TaxID=185979 RepID=UPI00061736EC|nr:hypothetical protein [Bacillus sp. TH008]KKB71859.1 hypothetical protein TH62_19815 [Bacillus sp. TH008]